MATFTALAKISPLNTSAIQRYLGLAKCLSSENFHLYGIRLDHKRIIIIGKHTVNCASSATLIFQLTLFLVLISDAFWLSRSPMTPTAIWSVSAETWCARARLPDACFNVSVFFRSMAFSPPPNSHCIKTFQSLKLMHYTFFMDNIMCQRIC